MEVSSIEGIVLKNVPLISIKALTPLTMRMMMQDRVVICNTGDKQEVCWQQGALICAFGKGKFSAKSSESDVDEDKEILFKLESHKDLVIYNGAVMAVGDIIKRRKATHTTAVVNYHEMTENTEKPNEFTLALSHWVVFKPQFLQQVGGDDQGGMNQEDEEGENQSGANTKASLQASAGVMIPMKKWDSNHSELLWSVQWKAKGLMPIRPQVVFRGSGSLGIGRAIELIPKA